jgi:hypothetical protein
MACWHRRYALGDRHDYPDPRAFSRAIHPGNAVLLPLYLLDHAGLTLGTDPAPFRACDPAGWDWGQVGYIYVTKTAVRREFDACLVSPGLRRRVEACLHSEVATYARYLRGEVFGFVLSDRDTGEERDACWGFYGDDPLANGMADSLPADVVDALRLRYRSATASAA